MCPVAGLPAARALLRGLQAVVGRVADQVDQRVGQALDHRLVQLSGLALGREFDGLAGVAGQVVDQAAEAPEQLGDRHHADDHHGVAHLRGQALDFLGDGAQGDVAAAGGQLLEARLGDDEFADAVHHLVQALGRDADGVAAGLGGAAIVGGLRRGGLRGGGGSGVDGDLGDGLLAGFRRRGGGQILDLQGHVVDHEDEDILDSIATVLGDQGHVPGQVAFGRDQGVEIGNGVGDGDDRARAQLAQLVQQRQGTRAVDQGVGRQAEFDAPGVQARSGGSRRGRGGRITGAGDHAVQLGEQDLAGGLFGGDGPRPGRACGPGKPGRRRQARAWRRPRPCAHGRRRFRSGG